MIRRLKTCLEPHFKFNSTHPMTGFYRDGYCRTDAMDAGRPFTWRKKWEKVWNEVRYCSDRCKTHRAKTRPYALKPSAP